MYVCICKGVTESQICEAIERGLCTRREIAACLKAGTGCGKCGPDIRELLNGSGAHAENDAPGGRVELRDRKYTEQRRHTAVAGRTRRAAASDKLVRDAMSGSVNSSGVA